MIEELKPYEALRPSGDPWLGEIPKVWSQKRLWSMSSPRVERNPGKLPLLSVFLDRGVIPYGEGGGQVHAPSLDLSNYQVVHPGDFVLNNQQAWRGSVGVSRHHGIISPAYIVLRLNGELLPAYANYLFRCPRLVDQFVAASKGVGDIQRQVFWPFLRRVTVPIPSTTEQEAIVRFLDHANRRIDQFIRAKKKLIALLNEQKQAIIHRAVTRGLDPSMRLKHSGDTWLGEVPANWIVQRLWTLSRPRTERNPGNLPLLSVFLDRGVIPYGEGGGQVHAPSLDLSNYQVVHPGDFVLNNQQAWRGSVGVSRHHGIISPAYIVLDVSERIDPAFGNYLFRSRPMVDQFVAASKGVGDIQRQVYWPLLRRVLVPIPSLGEQAQIATSLDEDLKGLTSAIRRTEGEVLLLNEYRARLVADAVTGQLDVRASAAGLPVVEPEAAPTQPESDETDIEDCEAA